MKIKLIKTQEFVAWFEQQTDKIKVIIDARLDRMAVEAHWGFIRRFDGLIELKWKSGLRVYTALVENSGVLVLLGGFKHAQKRDIKKAKAIHYKYTESA